MAEKSKIPAVIAKPTNTGTPFGQAQKPVSTQTVAANQRENRAPAPTQTINLYGSPATNTRPAPIKQETPKKTTKIPTAGEAASARYTAEAADFAAGTGKYAQSSTIDKRTTDESTGKTVLRSVTNSDGTVTIFYSDGTSETFGTPTVTPVKKEIIPNVAYDTIQKILESYRITGLASVLESIRDEYPEADSTELLTLLQFDSRYNAKFNERFAANVVRQKAGKPVLSPGEYLKLEQAYSKVFESYNLPKFNTQDYYDKFIIADTDPTEVTERVQMAYDRIMGDEPVLSTFKKFYSSLGLGDIVTGMLDPANQLPALQQKVKAAEIGGAAVRQGLTASELATTPETTAGYSNVTTGTLGADVLARAGVTKAQAEEGYQKIAQVLPTGEKLSSIYGKTADQYGRVEAEQEQLQGLASAARKRQKLSELEVAQFKKSSGLGRGALGTITNI
jgi:hypothetical protein